MNILNRAYCRYGISLIIVISLTLFINVTIAYAQTYYIDKDSIGGTCSDAGPGTLTQPWCSWKVRFWDMQQPLQPGDIVYIRGGVYYERFNFQPAVVLSGTSGNPITISTYPGEKVAFDGSTSGGNGIQITGNHSYLTIIGPLEIRNFDACMESGGPNYGWVIEQLDAHDCGRGLLIRNIDGFTLRDSIIHHTNGDGGAGGVFMYTGTTNVLIENVMSYSHNDGRGIDGDADGFWAHQGAGTIVMRNVTAYGNSEDGFDLKAQNVTIENGKSFDNSTVGFKAWFGIYNVTNFLTYNNGEDGIKCSETTQLNLNHVTSVGNVESGLQTRTAGCVGTVQNSIFANNGNSAVELVWLATGKTLNMTFKNNIFQHAADPVIATAGCPGISWSAADITNGTFNSDLVAGVSCGVGIPLLYGSNANALTQDPLFVNAPLHPISSTISAAVTGLTSVDATVTGTFPWRGYSVGSLIELDNDNILRKITSVAQPTISFVNDPLATPYSGRSTDGAGVRIVDWGTATLFDNLDDYNLQAGSPAINSGIFIPGTHCATADDDPVSPMDPAVSTCVHWSGTSPDMGALPSNSPSSPSSLLLQQ